LPQIGYPSKISKRPNSKPEVEIDAVQTPIFTVRLGIIDAVVDFRQRAPQVPSVNPTLGTPCNTDDSGVWTPNRERPGLPNDVSHAPLRPIGAEKIGVKFSNLRPNSREVRHLATKLGYQKKRLLELYRWCKLREKMLDWRSFPI